MVVERNARANHVKEGNTAVRVSPLDERHQLMLVTGETSPDVSRSEEDCQRHEINRIADVADTPLRCRARISGRRKLAFGQSINAVVLDDINHLHATPEAMGEMAQPDRRRIAVARNAEVY